MHTLTEWICVVPNHFYYFDALIVTKSQIATAGGRPYW